jgi:acetyltransferase-like isoleucine patch superfamily enzyme
MNIFKKAISELKRRFLSVHYRISKKNYQHAFLSYLKFIGVKLDGKPKFFARDVKLDLSNPSLISIGEGSVITSKVTILTHDYSIECGLVAIGKEDPVYESLINKPVTIGKNVFVG